MPNNPVDIIMVTYNRIHYLKISIIFLHLFTDYPFRLIVVDNGSKDGSRELLTKLKEAGAVWKVVFNKANIKLAAAFSEGFKHVEADLCVTVADDMLPPIWMEKCWLTMLRAKLLSDESIGCVNMIGNRRDYVKFFKVHLPMIYDKIRQEGGQRKDILEKLLTLL